MPEEGFEGRCLAIDPPHLLELLWGDDVVRIELRSSGAGTSMVFSDTLSDRRHAARDGAGWHLCLDDLAAHLDGGPAAGSHEQRWNAIHDRYLAAVGGERHVWQATDQA